VQQLAACMPGLHQKLGNACTRHCCCSASPCCPADALPAANSCLLPPCADGGLDLLLLLNLALDVARAMVHLHERGVVHGDLKARNVLLKSGSAEPVGGWLGAAGGGWAGCLHTGAAGHVAGRGQAWGLLGAAVRRGSAQAACLQHQEAAHTRCAGKKVDRQGSRLRAEHFGQQPQLAGHPEPHGAGDHGGGPGGWQWQRSRWLPSPPPGTRPGEKRTSQGPAAAAPAPGTPAFYAQVSRASDVYAFGIMVWELYTGQRPYEGVRRSMVRCERCPVVARPLHSSTAGTCTSSSAAAAVTQAPGPGWAPGLTPVRPPSHQPLRSGARWCTGRCGRCCRKTCRPPWRAC
jgi:serine/threonine protein kinase